MKEKIQKLKDKDDKIAYNNLLELEIEITESMDLYNYFDDLLELLSNKKSFVRVRAFRLICVISKWDCENKIEKNIDFILNELDDDTSTSVRQCLDKINLILLYKPELSDKVERNSRVFRSIILVSYTASKEKTNTMLTSWWKSII